MITPEALKRMSKASLQGYVRNRVYEVEPADPPAHTRDGSNYYSFLLKCIDWSRQESNPLASRIALSVGNIYKEIKEQVDQGGPKENHEAALRNLSLVVNFSKDELHQIPNGMEAIQRIAIDWTEEETTGPASWGVRLTLNAFSGMQREGDELEPWQRLWHQDGRPDIWMFAYIGLQGASFAEGLRELPKLVERSSIVPKVLPEVLPGGIWGLYLKARENPDTLGQLVSSLRELPEIDFLKVTSVLKGAGVEAEHVMLLSNR